jgi:signal transduction histidine kinase
MRTDRRSGADRRGTRRLEQMTLRSIVERMADGIVIVGLDGTIRFVNPAAEQLFGRPADELIATNFGYPLVTGESAEIEVVRPRGETVSVELRVVDTDWEGNPARLLSLRDVTDRKRAEERAAQLERERLGRAQAEAANRAKSEFLAMMSHELRTPLNAVIGYAELLQLGIQGPLTDDQRTQVTRILTSARHLLGLVNELLDLGQVDAGRLSVQASVTRLGPAVEAALALVQPIAEARGVSVATRPRGDPDVMYEADEDRVRQILVNLLTNAVKFTEPGGVVSIECGAAKEPDPEARLRGPGPWTYVRVEDTGVGIPAAQISAIFDPFVQVDTGRTRPRDGSGLGLTISRRLARLMKGDVSVRSELRKGSVFTLWLPAATATAQAAARWRGDAPDTAARLCGLGEVGDLLLRELERLVDAFVAHLRAERIIASADSLRFSQLAGYVAPYVADIARVLIAVEEARGQPSSLIADGFEIQRLTAERHGMHRARLGWSRETLSREWKILREEIERVIRRRAQGLPEAALSEAELLIERFLTHAEEVSARAMSRAAHDVTDIRPRDGGGDSRPRERAEGIQVLSDQP